MPDQPDDAPKRPPRGVFPPFFVPRNGGHAGGSPTPPSGSWRRVSRLFTPPGGTRQRRTPAAQQTPYTPPVTPAEPVVPVESLAPEPEVVEQQADLPAAGAPEAVVAPQDQEATEARAAEADALVLEHGAFDEVAGGAGSEMPAEEISAADAYGPGSELFSPHAAAQESAEDSLDAIAELAFDDGADDFMVESLEPLPITLDPSEAKRLDVAVESMDEILSPSAAELQAEPFASELTYDEMYSAVTYEEAESAQPEPTHEELESVERYLAVDPAQGLAGADEQDAPVAYDREEIVAYDEQSGVAYGESSVALDRESVAAEDQPSANLGEADGDAEIVSQDRAHFGAHDAVGEQAVYIDPWAGAELPEPAFGSIGWPTMDDALAASEPVADGADEMGAALAWSDEEGVAGAGDHHEFAERDAAIDADDALSAVAGELRESSSAWKRDGDSPVDERADVEARAHFYAAPEPIGLEDEIAAAEAEAEAREAAAAAEATAAEVTAAEAEVGSRGADLLQGAPYAVEMAEEETPRATDDVADPADEYAGAAIADALARVAARIRSGEIDLPSEVVGASDESALAAALAALLRGPRH